MEIEDIAVDKAFDQSEIQEAHGNGLPEGVCCTVLLAKEVYASFFGLVVSVTVQYQLTWVCPSVGHIIDNLASEFFVKSYISVVRGIRSASGSSRAGCTVSSYGIETRDLSPCTCAAGWAIF